MVFEQLYKAILNSTGLTIDYIQKTPLDRLRREAEERTRKTIFAKDSTKYVLSRKEVDNILEEALAD